MVTAMSTRPRREAVLQRVTIAGEGALPSLAALFHKTVDIAGTGKRKIDGEYAATRLGGAMTSRWANERFRQVMLLVRQFRMEWPNKSLLTADDTEFVRSAIDVALTTAAHEGHTGGIYDCELDHVGHLDGAARVCRAQGVLDGRVRTSTVLSHV